jgi:hypothetical protein
MKKLLLLLIFLSFQSLISIFKQKSIHLTPRGLSISTQKIEKWFDTYSCSELKIEEKKSIAQELEKIIREFDGNLDHLESLLAQYCHEVAKKHLHSECFLAVVKAVEEAILQKYNKPMIFREILGGYSQKINDAVNKDIL